MKNIVKFLFINLSAIAVLCSCSDSCIESVNQTDIVSREASVSLFLHTAPSIGELDTRSINSQDVDEGEGSLSYIKDVYLIEYVNAPDGIMIGNPRYFSGEKELNSLSSLTLNLPTSSEVEYVLIAIANTHNPNMIDILRTKDTLNKLRSYNHRFTKEEDGVQSNTDSSKDLLLNGYAIIKYNTSNVELNLERNVAKLDFIIKNMKNSGVTITSVTLKNVPNVITYANSYFGKSNLKIGVNGMCFDFTKEEINTSDLIIDTESETCKLSYYIPQNCQGTNASTDPKNKNRNAPAHATYLEILGNKSDGSVLRYVFYPGENMTNNFNIKANHHYMLPITILNAGDANLDSRIESIPKLEMLESANSYIISYIGDSINTQPSYSIPIGRANTFWDNTSESQYIIDEDTEWVAEVIWQDVKEDLFYFCDSEGQKQSSHFFNGSGPGSFTVMPKGGVTGNVIIGVRNKNFTGENEGYCWSWHLWITDYRPNPRVAVEEGVYRYKAGEGYMHRYGGWKEAMNGNFIMDRNYGAHSPDPSKSGRIAGLYYMFGKKDPIPEVTVYKYYIDNEIEVLRAPQGSEPLLSKYSGLTRVNNLEYVIKHPNHYFGDSSWYSGSIGSGWIKGSWQSEDEKSIFDPCPPGWRIPDTIEEYGYAGYIKFCKDGVDNGNYFYLDNETSNEDDIAYMPTTSILYPNPMKRHPNMVKQAYLLLTSGNATTSYDCMIVTLGTNTISASKGGTNSGRAVNMRLISDY